MPIVELTTAIIAWIVILGGFVLALVLPSIINILASVYITRKITRRWMYSVPVFLLISVLLSGNFRIIDISKDMLDNTQTPKHDISRKVSIRPDEKIGLILSEPNIYYRRDSRVAHWGYEWFMGISPIPMIVEYPDKALRRLSYATTVNNPANRVTIEVRSSLINGRAHTEAIVKDEIGVAAIYSHIARRNIGLDRLDHIGFQSDPWRAYFSLLTQKTLWSWDAVYHPKHYKPLQEFFEKALYVKEIPDDDPKIVDPETLSAVGPIEAIGDELIPNSPHRCEGESYGQKYRARSNSSSVTINWDDKEYPQLITHVDNRYGRASWLHITECTNNKILVSAVMREKVMVWLYEPHFPNRKLILKKWIQFPLPKLLSANAGNLRAYLASNDAGVFRFILARPSTVEAYIVTATRSVKSQE